MSFTYNPLLNLVNKPNNVLNKINNLVNKPNNVLNKINNLVKWNSYIYDLIHSAAIKSKDFLNSEKNSNKIFQPFLNDFIYGKTNDYTDNNINLNVQKSLDSYLNLMGYGNAISTLSFDNKSTILVNSKGELVIKENINYNSLNFGGYIDSNKYKNIKGIVYTNKKNEQIMVPIIINEGNLYGWNSPILGKRNKEINKIHSSLGQFSFYNLSKNINANDISLNYSFEFWNDTNNDNEFSTNEILSMSNFKNNKFIKNNTITSYRGDAKKSNSSYYLIDENFKLIKRKVN